MLGCSSWPVICASLRNLRHASGFGAVEGEGVVGEDVGHVGDDVVEAGVLVVHGVGAAADAVGVGQMHWCGLDGSCSNSGKTEKDIVHPPGYIPRLLIH